MKPLRFSYGHIESRRSYAGLLAYLPITLSNAKQSIAVSALLDTGSTVNVLPYPVGLQLDLVWEQQK